MHDGTDNMHVSIKDLNVVERSEIKTAVSTALMWSGMSSTKANELAEVAAGYAIASVPRTNATIQVSYDLNGNDIRRTIVVDVPDGVRLILQRVSSRGLSLSSEVLSAFVRHMREDLLVSVDIADLDAKKTE